MKTLTERLSEYSGARAAAYAEYKKARVAWAEYNEVRAAAWRAIDDGSDPLVTWIIANCVAYLDEALIVLGWISEGRSLAAMDEGAWDKSWCETWDELKADALDAGVLSAEMQAYVLTTRG